ncbi:MAG: hypothetical protein H6922_01715 [Pseudomonadaceae bacterium]|nr:hypothetical protein [Pseudomonadaceae bacterium]
MMRMMLSVVVLMVPTFASVAETLPRIETENAVIDTTDPHMSKEELRKLTSEADSTCANDSMVWQRIYLMNGGAENWPFDYPKPWLEQTRITCKDTTSKAGIDYRCENMAERGFLSVDEALRLTGAKSRPDDTQLCNTLDARAQGFIESLGSTLRIVKCARDCSKP